uniref:Protein-tyrosine-phosphatase n=1 Tax=Parastrongyloides trichosuri TaxID=131310 RepID=A0A0N4ZI66_PARTI
MKKDSKDIKGKGYENIQKWWTTFANSVMKDYTKILKHKDYRGDKIIKHDYDQMALNEPKCRYADIFCIDDTRVILKREFGNIGKDGTEKTDFIHANWITQKRMHQKYILCQGPMENTVEDMWEMLYQENVGALVMLCNAQENGLEKCVTYWPEGQQSYGPYNVKLVNKIETILEESEIREFEITPPNNITRNIFHFQVKHWPDHLAPDDPTYLLRLLKECKRYSNGRVIATHCSAGIGRSGTFVALQYLYVGMREHGVSEPMKLINDIRKQRHGAVQSYIQYAYCLVALGELFAEKGILTRNELHDKVLKNYKIYLKKTFYQIHKRTKRKHTKKPEFMVQDTNIENN